MKNLLMQVLITASLLVSNILHAQTLPNFDIIKMEQPADFKNAVPFVLQTATYLLSAPIDKENKDRLKSLQFISKWMTGTTDYSFRLDEEVRKITKGDNDLLGIYMAAMTKFSLENKEASKDPKQVKLNSLILLLNYCEKKENNIRMNKSLKKLSDARKNNQLEQALDSAQ